MGATLIDGIILVIPAEIVNAAVGRAAYYFFLIVIGAVYVTSMLVTRGQTVGMMAVGTKCIRESTGEYLTPGSALGRWAVAEVMQATVIVGLLDVLWPLWDGKNQTLHDKVSSSIVVRTR